MSEKEKIEASDRFDNVSRKEAETIICEAFESDPNLEIKTGRTLDDMDLLVNYTNTSSYREGDEISICIYRHPIEDVNLISQVYPFREDRENDLALRIFLNEDSPSTFYTSRAKNWHNIQKEYFVMLKFQAVE